MVCYYVTRVIRYADLCRSLQIDAHVRLRDADVTRALAAVYLVHNSYCTGYSGIHFKCINTNRTRRALTTEFYF